jgi:DNA-binding XRE family transcriptional regulator
MDLKTYRKHHAKLSQEECARVLGIRSKGYICRIENEPLSASLKVALRIEKWSGGQVTAASLSREAADLATLQPMQAA